MNEDNDSYSAPIRGNDQIKVVDLRNILKISSGTMSKLMKKKGYSGRVVNGAQARDILTSRGVSCQAKQKVISFLICKGGTAKTTSAKFISERVAAYGNKVLLIDADPQGNLTKAFNLESYDLKLTPQDPVLADILDKNSDINLLDAIIPLTDNLDLVPSTPINSKCDNIIRSGYKNPAAPLAGILAKAKSNYDFIMIDCGPSLSITNTAVIGASDMIVMPVDPDEFSLIGIDQTIDEVDDIKKECGVKQDIDVKLFLTKYDDREYLSAQVLLTLREKFPGQCFLTHIRKSSDLKNCIYEDQDLFSLSRSRAKEDYDELAREIMGINVGG